MLLSSLDLARPTPVFSLPDEVRLRIIDAAGAGFPSPAQDWEDPTLDLIELLRLDRAASFVFRVSGVSMHDAGFFDRDVVVVDRDRKPANGSIVIAIVEGGFVIRQFVIRGKIPYLEARNASIGARPIRCDEDVEVWGVVRASIRDVGC